MPSMDRQMTTVGLAGLGLFQLGLAVGAPWGRASYGGTHPGVLPPRWRATSAGAFLAYSGVAWAVVSPRVPVTRRRKILAGVAGVMGLGAAVNGLSPSVPERALWTPTSALLAVTAWRARRDYS
jgi:hypothetical protein